MVERQEPPEPSPTRIPPNRGRRRPATRERVALALAFVALVCALIGAYGPADRIRSTHSWPPSTLPAKRPTDLWYSPLLLAAHRPEGIDVQIPCGLGPSLPATGSSPVVIATARNPQQAGALSIARRERLFVISVGDQVLRRLPVVSEPTDRSCAYRMRLSGRQWSVEGGSVGLPRSGALDSMPRVFGVFSELDLRRGPNPRIAITTIPHATEATVRQTAAWVVAVSALIAALLLLNMSGGHQRLRSRVGQVVHSVLAHVHPMDGVVVAALFGWWLLAPLTFDDGWVVAREQMYESSRGFSLYYTTLGANLPLDYWLEWSHHWIADATSSLVVLRIPTLLSLMTLWVLCRWMVTRTTASVTTGSGTRWPLMLAFLVSALAWGMTLRPEPFIALLIAGAMASTIRFLEHPTTITVTAVALLVPFALAGHTTGVLALAPVLVAAPELIRWARSHAYSAATVIGASGALLTVLLFVGSDLGQRRADAQVSAAYAFDWRDEFSRYSFLNGESTGTPLRRIAVALLLLAVVAFVLRHRRGRDKLLNFPTAVLAVGLVLLALTPSKWAWHFGALIGVGAVAITCETARLRLAESKSSRWSWWPFIAILVAGAVGHWSWWVNFSWNIADLRYLTWYPGLASALSWLALLLPAYLLLGLLGIGIIRGQRAMLHRTPWRVASLTVPLLVLPGVLYTVGVLAIDTARADGWTLGRQNLSALSGDQRCGLANDLILPTLTSARALPSSTAPQPSPVPSWLPTAPILDVPRFVLSPGPPQAATPWFKVSAEQPLGVFVSGVPATTDQLLLDWGRLTERGVEQLSADEFTPTLRYLPGTAPWRFLTREDLPPLDPNATHARISFRTTGTPRSALAVTPLMSYEAQTLASVLDKARWNVLVYPELLPYFPCARLPILEDGVVDVPSYAVLTMDPFALFNRDLGSPFVGLRDMYALERVSTSDTPDEPGGVIVIRLHTEIPGAAVASTVVTSTRFTP